MKNSRLFNQAVAAAKEVMDRGVWAIYNTGNKLDDYRQMFQTTDLSGNPEVLWYKQYDGDQIGNNVNRYLNQGGGSVGVTASLVDDYLTIDGKPFVGDERIEAKRCSGMNCSRLCVIRVCHRLFVCRGSNYVRMTRLLIMLYRH